MREALGLGLAANEGFWNSISTEFHLLAHNRVGKKIHQCLKKYPRQTLVGKNIITMIQVARKTSNLCKT